MLHVSRILRPQLTIRYLLPSFAFVCVSYYFLTGVPLASSSLPSYTGQYDVGTIDLEVPCEPRKIHDAVDKETGLPAFELETVLFSVFYPATKGASSDLPQHSWISKPVSLMGEGYARLVRINNYVINNIFTFGLWSLGGHIRIPANVDVPMVAGSKDIQGDDASNHQDSPASFPVIVFSHGMASSRTDYTQYCAELASRGYIVAAIEHRDGSCPASVVMREDGTTRTVYHMTTDQLQHDTDLDTADLKEIQLSFRQAEVEETIRALHVINNGHGQNIYNTNPRQEGQTLSTWRDRLLMEELTIAGHSYGATLALQTLKYAPSATLPIKSAIILDPGKHSGALNDDINVHTLVIHSDSWSKKFSIFFGRPHFEVVKELVQGIVEKGKAAWFMTSVGTSHPSVTDAPLIQPMLLSWTTGSTIDVKEGVKQYVKVSLEFLEFVREGSRKGILKEDVTHTEYDVDVRDERRKEEMDREVALYWQIHVTPDEVEV